MASKLEFQDYICRPFCDYFRPETKEELLCRGAQIVETLVRRQRFRTEDFQGLNPKEPIKPGQERDLEAAVCFECPFRAEDCDFQSQDPPPDCRPCGGMVLLYGLKTRGMISPSELRQLPHGG